MYTHVLGMLNSNSVGVSAIPTSSSSQSVYQSRRAEDILNGWIRETDFISSFDEGNQVLLQEGMFAYHPYIDQFRKEVFVRVFPQSELFPIPYDARTWNDLHGLIHATVVTKQWLELQDALFEMQTGRPPIRKMADKAKGIETGLHLATPGVAIGTGHGKIDGAVAKTIWMRKTEQVPSGEYLFMINDEVFRHAVGKEQTGQILYNGEIPCYPVYYDKIQKDFWGPGLCERMIPQQLSQNRALTDVAISSKRNKPFTAVNSDLIAINDIQDEDDALIPFRGNAMTSNSPFRQPAYHFPATTVGRDTFGVLQFGNEMADRAVGLRSGIAFGQQEGRTESGPATSILAQNATAPLNSAMGRHALALSKVYVNVLDFLRHAWPPEKTLRISGPNNVGREIKVLTEQMPWSKDTIIRPRPIVAGGRQQMLSMLFGLKQLPGPDGKQGTEITNQELRQSIYEMELMPPGLQMFNTAEARIQTRINQLIGDGQQPGIQPSDATQPSDKMMLEKHRLAMEMLKDAILDDSFESYSPLVQKALMTQLDFHRQWGMRSTEDPNNFDDDVEKLESLQMEQFLAAAEADLETPEGTFAL
jgi:hypothetical protein